MTWQEHIREWKSLPEDVKLHLRWEAIPQDVAESMSFEDEPVLKEFLSEILARIEPPTMLAAKQLIRYLKTDIPLVFERELDREF